MPPPLIILTNRVEGVVFGLGKSRTSYILPAVTAVCTNTCALFPGVRQAQSFKGLRSPDFVETDAVTNSFCKLARKRLPGGGRRGAAEGRRKGAGGHTPNKWILGIV